MFLSEEENFTEFRNTNALVWHLDDLRFGSWSDGPSNDGSRVTSLELIVPKVRVYCYNEGPIW